MKRVYWILTILLVLGAAVGGYYFRPWIDLRFVDYPLIGDAALYGVEMYEYVAERLADYPVYQESIELVFLEYNDIASKITDSRLREVMREDERYALVDKLEGEFPWVRVINLEAEEEVVTIQLHFSDGETVLPFTSPEAIQERFEITAAAIRLMAEQYPPSRIFDVQWIAVIPTKCLGDRCVRATIAVGIKAPAPVFLQWAELSAEKLGKAEGTRVLEDGGAVVFVDTMWTPWIYVEEELPRLSTDPAPWDQDWFYQD